jgi:hypothetical protein
MDSKVRIRETVPTVPNVFMACCLIRNRGNFKKKYEEKEFKAE